MAEEIDKPKKARKKAIPKSKVPAKGVSKARKSKGIPVPPRPPKAREKREIDWQKLAKEESEILLSPAKTPKPAPEPPPSPVAPPKPVPRGVFPHGWYAKSRSVLIILALFVFLLLLYKAADFYLQEKEQEPVLETLQLETSTGEEIVPEPVPKPESEQDIPYEEPLPSPEIVPEIPPSVSVPPSPMPAPAPVPKPAPHAAPVSAPPMATPTPTLGQPVRPAITDTPRLAIVIDDMGLSGARLDALMATGLPLTLSFLPYGRDAALLVKRARKRGFEILVHVPMEPLDRKIYSGPKTLRVAMDPVQIQEALRQNLDSLEGYVGINNHMGSAFTQRAEKLAPVMEILRERGLIFLDSRTSSRSVAFQTAEAHGVTALGRDVFIDNVRHVPTIVGRLNQAAQLAKKRGYAIAIGHPHLETIQALKSWRHPGVQVVFLTHLLEKDAEN